MKVTVVIPNYNGIQYLKDCLLALQEQSYKEYKVLVVDNGSNDGSTAMVEKEFPWVEMIRFSQNKGFCAAVNAGIQKADTPYVILLNNDTKPIQNFVKTLIAAIEEAKDIFSVSAKMLQMSNPSLIDDAGDYYCALGWAFARGKGKPESKYAEKTEIFAACGGAAIYRKAIIETIGLFDEQHFAYLEDIDIGYRARIFGYRNLYEPKACVLHAGSGYSGSRYNKFKVSFASANSVYLISKNMPFFQLLLNLPFLLAGFFIKTIFFLFKGMGGVYVIGLLRGIRKSCSEAGRKNKVRFEWKNLPHYLRIQWELWRNLFMFINS